MVETIEWTERGVVMIDLTRMRSTGVTPLG